MKKLLGILALLVILAIIILFLLGGLGWGTGGGSGEGKEGKEGNESTRTEETQESPKIENNETPSPEEETEEKETIIKVSVVESDYFYDSERVDLDTLAEIIQEFDEKPTVKIIDDNASLKAYNKLLDRLEELEISYLEEN